MQACAGVGGCLTFCTNGRALQSAKIVSDECGLNPNENIIALMETTKTTEGPKKSREASLPLPAPVARALDKLGGDLNRARRRRNFTQQEVADRIGASLNTVKRLENGNLKIPLHFLARMLFLYGELDRLKDLLDSAQDEIGLTLMDSNLPQRVRSSKKRENAF